MKFERHIAADALMIYSACKPLINSVLAFQSMGRDRADLDFVAGFLQAFDETRCVSCITKRGINDQVQSTLNSGIAKLTGPGASVGVGLLRPTVR